MWDSFYVPDSFFIYFFLFLFRFLFFNISLLHCLDQKTLWGSVLLPCGF